MVYTMDQSRLNHLMVHDIYKDALDEMCLIQFANDMSVAANITFDESLVPLTNNYYSTSFVQQQLYPILHITQYSFMHIVHQANNFQNFNPP